MNKLNTVVLINKDSGITSFACLNNVKKIINKKAGHCGTLDKFAEGLLIVCCGTYTKKVPLFMDLDKTYRAVLEFGIQTDTLDPEGQIIKKAEVPPLSEIERAVLSLKGKIMQKPPVYSAVHVNGERSYELARKGLAFENKEREVIIHSSEIIEWNSPFLTLELRVSKGTYIRSYAEDLGALCKSCAYVKKLERTSVGPFSVENAVKWNNVEELARVTEQNAETVLEKLKVYKE